MTPPGFKQGDLRWFWKKLGTSNVTMKTDGCYVAALAYDFMRYGIEHNISFMAKTTPGSLCDWLNKNGGFNLQGKIYHSAVQRYTRGLLQWTEGDPNGKIYTLVIVNIITGHRVYNHCTAKTPGSPEMVMDSLDGKIKKLAQSIWTPTGRRIYLKK